MYTKLHCEKDQQLHGLFSQLYRPSTAAKLVAPEDAKGNIYVSEILLNQIWVLSPDGSQRILIATKQTAPLDNNTSLDLKGDVLCPANLGFTHAKPEEADRTVVCMEGFPLPK